LIPRPLCTNASKHISCNGILAAITTRKSCAF
jgi:hypothetical protein